MLYEVKTAHLDKFSWGKKIMELPVSYAEKLILISQKPWNFEAGKVSLLAIAILLPFFRSLSNVCTIFIICYLFFNLIKGNSGKGLIEKERNELSSRILHHYQRPKIKGRM